MSKKRYTVAVDFDGVLHRYDTPWIAPHIIPDGPVVNPETGEHAIHWLMDTLQKFDVVIFSTRCRTWRGRRAVRRWLKRQAEEWGERWKTNFAMDGSVITYGLCEVRLSYAKPPALVYIDDRAWRFTGHFPTKTEIHLARPWHKKQGQG